MHRITKVLIQNSTLFYKFHHEASINEKKIHTSRNHLFDDGNSWLNTSRFCYNYPMVS